MDGAKFAKMLSDKHLFELDRMEYKYSVSSVKEFAELLRQNFAQPLPLADFSSDELFYLPNLAQISTNGMKQLLSAPASNQTFGLPRKFMQPSKSKASIPHATASGISSTAMLRAMRKNPVFMA